MRNNIIKPIFSYARKNKKAFLITGDAGFGILDKFKENFPKRFLNLGIAEQNMIGFASGMALAGYKVFVYNIAPFVLFRCYQQVRNDICYQNLAVTLIGTGSGLTYAPQGVTHYAVEDITVARSLPNLVILSPSDPLEAEECAKFACKSKAPVYIRIAKSGEPPIHRKNITTIERPILLQKGKGVGILFHGSISAEVMTALKKIKVNPTVISVPMLQPLNFKALKNLLSGIKTVVTIEEHYLEGGLGSIISDWINREDLKLKLLKLGISNSFVHHVKNNAEMRDFYGISSEKIAHTINRLK